MSTAATLPPPPAGFDEEVPLPKSASNAPPPPEGFSEEVPVGSLKGQATSAIDRATALTPPTERPAAPVVPKSRNISFGITAPYVKGTNPRDVNYGPSDAAPAPSNTSSAPLSVASRLFSQQREQRAGAPLVPGSRPIAPGVTVPQEQPVGDTANLAGPSAPPITIRNMSLSDVAQAVAGAPRLSPEEKAKESAQVSDALKNTASGYKEGAEFFPKAAAQAASGAANLVFNDPTSPYVQQDPVHAAEDLAEGSGKLGMIALPEAALTAPLATASGLAGAVAGSYAGEKATKKLGGGPEAQRFVGDIAGAAGAVAGGGFGHFLDTHEYVGPGTQAWRAGVPDPQTAADAKAFKGILKEAGVDLPRNATLDEATSAYRKAMSKLHPDVNPEGGESAKNLNTTWDNLKAAGVFPDEPSPASTPGIASRISQKLTDAFDRAKRAYQQATRPKPAQTSVPEGTALPAPPDGFTEEVEQTPSEIHESAKAKQPETVKTAQDIAAQVPGARVVDPGAKPPESIERKADADRDITDAARAQIVVPDEAAKQKATQAIAQQTPAHEIQPIEADSLPIVAAKLPERQEIQVATEAEHQAQAETHGDYAKIQEAKAAGNDAEAEKLQKNLDNDLAQRKYNNPNVEMVPLSELEKYLEFDRAKVASLRDPDHLERLTADVKQNGLNSRAFDEPLELTYDPATKKATLGDGNHRFPAAKAAGLESLPVRVSTEAAWAMGKNGLPVSGHTGAPKMEYKPSEIGIGGQPSKPSEIGIGDLPDGVTPKTPERQAHEAKFRERMGEIIDQKLAEPAALAKGSSVTVDGKPGTLTYLSKRPFEKSRVKTEAGEVAVPHREVARRIQPAIDAEGAEKASVSNPPQLSTSGEETVQPEPKVGDTRRVMGVDSTLAQVKTDDNGMRYELFNGSRLKESRAHIVITDTDSGHVSQVKQYPTFDAAEKTFKEGVPALNSGTTVPEKGAIQGVTSGTPDQPQPKPDAIAWDLDKSLAHYEDGSAAKDPTKIGAPIPENVALAKRQIANGKDVWVYSARAQDPKAVDAIKAWTKENVGKELPVTNVKHPEFGEFYDDRSKPLPVQQAEAAPVNDGSQIENNRSENENAEPVKTAEKPYKYGSTQANIPHGSDASNAIIQARNRISDSDLAGKGKDVGGEHVTVRYGIQSDDTAGVKKYLATLAPFEAKLGKTASFPASTHSDGAAVIIAPIEAPELHKINAELEKHGDFSEPSFPEYKPHATVAYVKPEAVSRYVGMSVTEGKTFPVDEIAITNREGVQEVVSLKGEETPKPSAAKPKSWQVAKPSEREQKLAQLDKLIKVMKGRGHRDDYEELVHLRARHGAVAAGESDPGPIKKSAPDESAVAPGTEPPSQLEQWKKQLAKAESGYKKSDRARASELRSKIKEAESAVRESGLPLTKPKETLVTDPTDKWEYQKEYFINALEPAADAWVNHANKMRTAVDPWESVKEMAKVPVWNSGDEKNRPAEFPDEFIRIEVPNDGKFLVKNTPAAIDKLLKSAPRAFAEPKFADHTIKPERKPGKGTADLNPEKLITHWEKEVADITDKLKKATTPTREMLQEDLAAARENLADAKKLKSVSSGGGLAASESGEFVPRALADALEKASKAYEKIPDAALQKLGMGRAYSRVERDDPEVAADLRELQAAPQYYRAKADQIVEKITHGMTREQEKGFVLMADQASREWLQKNHLGEYQKYVTDPRIEKALADYKPEEEDLRAKQKALGGPTIDEDYLRRVYDEHVAGVDKKVAKGEQTRVSADRVITPQMANKKGRSASAEYYYNNGLHEFGPSFATRYVATNLKLAEHNAAMTFLSRATKIDPQDGLPPMVDYNGTPYFRGDMARLIRESTADSPEGKQIAADLGLEQLPKPSEVREYGLYDPTPQDKSDFQAKKLAQLYQEAAERASGTKLTEKDFEDLLARSAAINHSSHPIYAGPKEITEAFQNFPGAIPGFAKDIAEIIDPLSNMIRRQVIGFGFGVPHMANVLRRVTLATSPAGVLDPRGWANAYKVAFNKELRNRAVSGVDDPAFAALLKHAGISDHGIAEYRNYLDSNFDAPAWDRAWKMLKASGTDWKEFEKKLLADIKANAREGGAKGYTKAGVKAISGAVETPFRPMLFMGHHMIFGPGGIDQRARLWLYDFIRAQDPSITDDEMAHRINMTLGRYNKASWTDFQKAVRPLMLFPGWDYSSVEYNFKNPLRTWLPRAILFLIANEVLYHFGKNKKKDSRDLSRLHVGNYSFSSNLVKERLADAASGTAQRAIQGKLLGHGNEQAVRDALSGVGSDARAFVGMMNPLVATPIELATGKELATGRDIVQQKDKRHAFGPEKDWAKFVAKKLFPVASQVSDQDQGHTSLAQKAGTFALHNIGVSAYRSRRKRK